MKKKSIKILLIGAWLPLLFCSNGTMEAMKVGCGLNVLDILRRRAANKRDKEGRTPLYLAVQAGDIDRVEKLVRHGAKIDKLSCKTWGTDNDRVTPFFIAVKNGNLALTKFFIEHGANINCRFRETPLGIAAQNNNMELVKILVASGADINGRSDNGTTPLHDAADKGHLAIVEFLLSRPGISINLKASNGKTPLDLALDHDRDEIVECLLRHGAINTYHDASINSLRYFKGHHQPSTLLYRAVKDGNLTLVKRFLYKGADPNRLEKRDKCESRIPAESGIHGFIYKTPLYAAVKKGYLAVVEVLLQHKANPNGGCGYGRLDGYGRSSGYLRELNGSSPLCCAIEERRLDMIKILLRYGASITATNEDGLMPLDIALKWRHDAPIVRTLVEHGADINEVVGWEGNTRLHRAAEMNKPNVVLILLSYPNIAINKKNKKKFTALRVALDEGTTAIIDLLVMHGADVTSISKYHKNIHLLHEAIEKSWNAKDTRNERVFGCGSHAVLCDALYGGLGVRVESCEDPTLILGGQMPFESLDIEDDQEDARAAIMQEEESATISLGCRWGFVKFMQRPT